MKGNDTLKSIKITLTLGPVLTQSFQYIRAFTQDSSVEDGQKYKQDRYIIFRTFLYHPA
jgi:hypothetical protein